MNNLFVFHFIYSINHFPPQKKKGGVWRYDKEFSKSLKQSVLTYFRMKGFKMSVLKMFSYLRYNLFYLYVFFLMEVFFVCIYI